MRQARLIRVQNHKEGTLGVLTLDGEAFGCTLEPPDLGNLKNRSCIPTGQYFCSNINSPSKGVVYEVKDVPGRSYILIHPGNTIFDTEGCILLGQSFGKLFGNRAVLNSGLTYQRFMLALNGEGFLLTVVEAW